ncbi:M14 family metallocarboxypeptidase [Rubellicoccus peritrichatus]|uniref:M14 family metallocarboxypeptidase n=1 Tax=Rubellicoccus peritrichatus TaxID=3080537 RepID=A0AAQ3LCN5_9BACT|nr:M14 family metallocarboxypeptidase [Puniceicoccus sp. CR14]WOO43356.1 M14 family metallocarboxypeptidase [Puniceicoccus sp. CR14]
MGYEGETIDVAKTIETLKDAAKRDGFSCGQTTYKGNFPQLVLQRKATKSDRLILISSGIHGDEPAGPLSILQLLEESRLSHELSWLIFPILCPENLSANRRECADGADPNRDYRNPQTAEIQSQVEWIAKHNPAIDTALLLHEDWESKGYYLYEQVTYEGRSFAPEMRHVVSPICGINKLSEIEGMPAEDGLISLRGASPFMQEWPESVYIMRRGAIRSYTLEAPSAMPLEKRVAAHIAAVNATQQALLPRVT